MTHRLILSRRAMADIDDIWEYSAATWSPMQADRYLSGLEGILRLLCHEPGLGRQRREFRPPVKLYPYRSHLIFYQSDVESVDVIRVLHARSDWQSVIAE